ncbi:hypothetical protein BJY24_000166 [Nocardia transvalensis]|uniref:DUF5642 domain-containing protein n=1 Tax=Nocardia transvalensis TaxID=37333 RepID=A0A7W9UFK3_9NOCA|nr:DUF5642 family protein [Nocardia transvalensis]MBB5911299.1 hypothetical protein [Nocardia transvalensis]
MIVPDSPGPRPRLDARAAARALVAVLVAGVLAGCGATVAGHPVAERQTSITRHVGTPLPALLPGQDRFPASYAAVVLPADQARRAAADLVGVPPGARADPQDCAPSTPRFDTDRTAVVVGTDDGARATLTVELARTDQPLSGLRDQVRRCDTVRVQRGPLANAVVTQLDPPPPIDADDALALRRTVSGPVGGPGLTQSMRTLVAQIGDVRITVTYMSFGDGAPDTTALDHVFDATVANVRKG